MNRAEFRKRILAANDEEAARLKRRFDESGTLVVDLVSAPGSGKTSLLEHSAARLADHVRVGAIVGDIATELDAERLAAAGMPSYQIVTGGACHLDARLVSEALQHSRFSSLDVLFIENVGNLVCPASYALGEDLKVALLSVAEGDDKPFKYPAIFTKAAATVITKTDLDGHVSFDRARVRNQVMTLNPSAEVFETSVISGQGVEKWCEFLIENLETKRRTLAHA